MLPGFLERWKSDWLDPAFDYMDKGQRSDSHLNDMSIEYRETDIRDATRNFDPKFLLGSGTFGSVYKGVMGDGTEVAIKVLQVPEEAGFEDEVKVLSRFRHPNLVILMGFARHADTGGRSLIYEYLAGGDVSKRLQRSRQQVEAFEWRARLSAAVDAACGLSHLHNMSPRAFHRDIKAPNILLDRNGTAKMADFGLSCVSSCSQYKVQQASGTVGYACPEYIRTGIITEGSEAHSYGMVLLEMLTGAPPAVARTDRPHEFHYLVDHLQGSVSKVMQMVDSTAHFPRPLAQALAEFAFDCIRPSPAERPLFKQIVEELRGMFNYAEEQRQRAGRGDGLAADAGGTGMMPGALDRTAHAGFHSALERSPRPPASQPPEGSYDGAQRFGVRRVTLAVGTPVECRWRGRSGWFCGHIAKVNANGTFAVQYSDGDVEDQVPAALVRLLELPAAQAGSAPRPAQTASGATGADSERQSHREEPPLARSAGQVRAPALVCRLWCIFSEGVDLARLEEGQRAIWWPSQSQDLVVGRTAQPAAFWNTLVPNPRNQSTVSRQHFRLVDRRANPNEQGSYTLQCMSLNGIKHNQSYIAQGEAERPVQHGDTVALAISTEGVGRKPFIAFAFEVVRPVSPPPDLRPQAVAPAAMPQSPTPALLASPHDRGQACGSGRWLPGAAGALALAEALYCLEVHGEDVNMSLPKEHRRLYSQGGGPRDAPLLRVGRERQRPFWQRVLRPDRGAGRGASPPLAPEHFEILALRRAALAGAVAGEPEWLFTLRCLGAAPLLVNGRSAGAGAAGCELRHGDELAAGPPPGGLRFTFVRLAQPSSAAPSAPSALGRPRPLPDVSTLWGDDGLDALGVTARSPVRTRQFITPTKEAGALRPPPFAGSLEALEAAPGDVEEVRVAPSRSSGVLTDEEEDDGDDPNDLFSRTGFRAAGAIVTDRT